PGAPRAGIRGRAGGWRLAVPALAVGVAACSAGLPSPGTEQGEEIAGLWRVFVGAAILVGGTVVALIAWSVLRYRGRGDTPPADFREHVPLEILYTAVPVLIVAALFALTVRTERAVDALPPRPAVTVHVTGFTWQWRFEYVGMGVAIVGTPQASPEMVLPAGERVRFVLTSDDVIHAFYVPGFLFKRDAIPGRVNVFEVVAPSPGTWPGRCAEFCGLGHAAMTFTVRVVPRAEFEAWLRAAGGGGP
ncbi:MAG TPA: cytochrome c oxidase subunit II, partial [Actinomycetota bacterium]|nr:cytochrome c oxidase subunit II [Actinomycetota bacterium]